VFVSRKQRVTNMTDITSARIADDSPFTVIEFCRRNRLSVSSYYELRKDGKGPREMRVLSKVLISPAAEADWRIARETPDPTDTATIERLHVRGRKAGRRPRSRGAR
jgi:hypothetical protein